MNFINPNLFRRLFPAHHEIRFQGQTALPLLVFMSVIFLTSCEEPLEMDADPVSLEADEIGIKRVEAVYIDEYGDQPHRDGKVIKYIEFDQNGNIKDKNFSLANITECKPLSQIELSSYDPLLTRGFRQYGQTFARELLASYKRRPYEDVISSKINVTYAGDQIIGIDQEYKFEMHALKYNQGSLEKGKITGTGMVNEQDQFEYLDNKVRHRYYRKTIRRMDNESLASRNVLRQMDGQNVYEFDQDGRLIAIYREDETLLKTYSYLENGLVGNYKIYNLKEELEYTVELRYKFY